jgi:predicted nucleic acid-binding Zn ribbon protein
VNGEEEAVLASEGPDPVVLGELLAVLTQRRGWSARLQGARVHDVWEEIAGAQLARHAEPVRLHGGVLVVRVASTTWATQLRFLGARLLSRANAVMGDGQVRSLTVVVGNLVGDPPA